MKTEEQTLESVLPELGKAYEEWKTSEASKNEQKALFFGLADKEITERGVAYKVVELRADTSEEAKARASLHYPGWLIDGVRQHRAKPEIFEVIIKEDPALKSFSIEVGGIKYGRTVSKGTVLVDDDWLRAADPELYEEVTWETPWGDRIMVPLDKLDKAALGKLTTYIYNDKPRVSLSPPRPVKEEE